MAHVSNTNNVAVGGFNPIRAINNLFSSISDSFTQSRKFEATVKELNALSSRELADLGISRSDITRIAYDAVFSESKVDYRVR